LAGCLIAWSVAPVTSSSALTPPIRPASIRRGVGRSRANSSVYQWGTLARSGIPHAGSLVRSAPTERRVHLSGRGGAIGRATSQALNADRDQPVKQALAVLWATAISRDVTNNWSGLEGGMPMGIKAIRIAVWVSRLLAAMFLFAGWSKLLGAQGDIQHFVAWRYPDWLRPVVGSIEVASAVLLLIPRAVYWGAAGISVTLLWAGYTFLVRVPQESWRALPTLTLLVVVAMVGYARRPKGLSRP
jgi:putative oxidoreductase